MKKALIIITIFVCSSSFGQSEKPTIFGIKGGYNRSIVNGNELNGDKTGFVGNEFYVSLFADTKISNKWSFENELLFSYTDDYHFLEFPIHMKYFIAKKWNILLGPKLDFILDNDNNSSESRYKFQNFGVSGEIGVQFFFLKRVIAETRYSYSFVEQIDDLGLEIYGGKRNTFRVGIAYRF